MISFAGRGYWRFVSQYRSYKESAAPLLLDGEGLLVLRETKSPAVRKKLTEFLTLERKKRKMPDKRLP